MTWKTEWKKWSTHKELPSELKKQMNEMSETEQEDAFYKQLEFGTGGMRGELGVGPNRMNIYTVRKVTAGLAAYIKENGTEAQKRGVVIAYDSRHGSAEFALEAAKTLGAHGIKSYVFEELRPTPELSFAVRYLRAYAGIMITASHNPAEYNGYKVYGEDGAQLPPKAADVIVTHMNKIENELLLEVKDERELLSQNLVNYIGENLDQVYLDYVKGLQLKKAATNIHIVYTPLHGTGQKLVPQALQNAGFQHITIVDEQKNPDPNFSTVSSPNPEEAQAFQLAIQYGKEIGADLLLATDPDADRLGVAVKNNSGKYVLLTGNQTGALLLHYMLSQKKEKGMLKDNSVILKTIVTSELGRAIAENYGVQTIDTLTGFKYIAEKIEEYNQEETKTFQFGYEESYGYLSGDFVRDKDAVQAAMMIAEAADYYKQQEMTLYDGLIELYETYGYYKESLSSFTLKGKDGAEQISRIVNRFRKHPPAEIADAVVERIEDYQSRKRINLLTAQIETMDLPLSNVLKFWLQDGSWFAIRPSGTEPKVKFYFGVKQGTESESEERLKEVKASVIEMVESIYS
ncbi:phosphoglucomutase [Priestia megaterium]|uniref:phospho-sugar mutase n=1 Tax=Priestia megaterium TaxID=1404 RepID=UPI000BF29154|nr:phospho-sugar mutase [Priestia megaterium]PET70538.1 phosphoglucomutase [Priestia megaterium]PFK85988.1 phosphoglucomutase [Priestia megaterium]